jgi:putative protease
MKILAPLNSPREVESLIAAGAGELYCGVLPSSWKKRYTNVASVNRREWRASNLRNYQELKEVVARAHAHNVPVMLALNAFYTKPQYPALKEQLEEILAAGVDALIVADLGFILFMKKHKVKVPLHISTGGTTFNSQTIKFYQELGASRIILPRHFSLPEIVEITQKAKGIEVETFILNRGCKNIDGFCTFQHGVNEVRWGSVWNIPKSLGLDYYLLNVLRRLPSRISSLVAGSPLFGSVGACFLNYQVKAFSSPATSCPEERLKPREANIAHSFNLLSGLDPCGACHLYSFQKAGVHNVKIVGRSNPTSKKLKDVRFLKASLDFLTQQPAQKDFVDFVREKYRQIYSFPCEELCYYYGNSSPNF